MPLIEQFSPAGQLSLRTLMYQTPGESIPIPGPARESPVVANEFEPPDRPDAMIWALDEKSLQTCETETVLLSENAVVSSCVIANVGRSDLPIVVSPAPIVSFNTNTELPKIG